MVRTASFAARAIGRYRVFVHEAQAPQDDEWEQVLELFRYAPDLTDIRTLVYTEGGAPNASQRRLLNELMGEAKPRIAVLTTSVIARAAGTALAWFNPQFRTFGPNEMDRALDHLEASGEERVTLKRTISELQRELRAVTASPATF